jgi:hypothetical protein
MANRFWVGGSGTWDTTSTANWSATTGGAPGASAPGAADIAAFDANSGTGTVTLGENVTVFRCTWNTFAGSFQPSTFAINCAGDGATALWIGGTTATFLAIPTVNFTYSGANSRTVTIGSATGFPRNINANITAGSGTFTLSAATNINNFNCTGFSGSLAATTGTLSLTGNVTLSSSMTIAANNLTIAFTGSGSRTITTNGVVIDRPINLPAVASGGGGVVNFADALTQGSTRTFNIAAGTVKFKNGVTSTVGAFGTSGTEQKFLSSTVAGSQATLSQASGTVNASNLTIQDINATGGATWNAFTVDRNIVNGNNSGWNFISIFKPIFPRKIVQRDVFKTVF